MIVNVLTTVHFSLRIEEWFLEGFYDQSFLLPYYPSSLSKEYPISDIFGNNENKTDEPVAQSKRCELFGKNRYYS